MISDAPHNIHLYYYLNMKVGFQFWKILQTSLSVISYLVSVECCQKMKKVD